MQEANPTSVGGISASGIPAHGIPAASEFDGFVLATANAHKVLEIRDILQGVKLMGRPQSIPEVLEDAPTLLGNARLKAQAVARATGLAAIADDSGLFVSALDGAPGVRSARYAGVAASDEQNVAALLEALRDHNDRSAEFRTVALVFYPSGKQRWIQGSIRGEIARKAAPGGGFGYDPVFVPGGGVGPAFSQMPPETKNSISHRYMAFSGLLRLL